MDSLNQSALTLDLYIECIARGHAFNKHVLGKDHNPGMQGVNAFRAEETKAFFDEEESRIVAPKRLGDDLFIETPDDMAHYIKSNFLVSEHTHGYVDPRYNSVNLYNSKDNVALHFSWNNSEGDLGTIYRYDSTASKFEYAQERAGNAVKLRGLELQQFDNAQDREVAVNAVQGLISDINDNPQDYLFTRNPESTVQNKVLNNVARPGRNWSNDEVLRAPNNVTGHSEEYAKQNSLDVDPADYVCIKQESESEFNVGRTCKSLRSGRVFREIKERGINFDVGIVPAIA